jgi:hypothetical protein
LLGAPISSDGDSCPKVTLPTDGLLQLSVFPMASLRRLIGLIRSDPYDLQCLVVHPNEHFLMIPLNPGVMRDFVNGDGHCAKTIDFLGLESVARCEAAVVATYAGAQVRSDDDDDHDHDPDGWASGFAGVAAELNINDEVVISLELLSGMKPAYSQRANISYADVCKELLPSGVAKLWTETIRFRLELGLPVKGLKFVDLGSGIGGVVFATLVMQADAVVSACGVERDADLHDTMLQWLMSAASRWPSIMHCAKVLEDNMINGDFTQHRGVFQVLQQADVVFCNNYLFDSPNGRQPALSLNDKLKSILCQHLRPDATLVTTCSLSDSRRPDKRPRDRGQSCARARVVVTHRKFKLKPSDVSWHGHLTGHIASIP